MEEKVGLKVEYLSDGGRNDIVGATACPGGFLYKFTNPDW